MPSFETYEFAVCACCLSAAFNADTSGHDYYCTDSPEPLALIGGEFDVVSTVLIEPDPYFSNSPCEGCGDLPGDRIDVEAFRLY